METWKKFRGDDLLYARNEEIADLEKKDKNFNNRIAKINDEVRKSFTDLHNFVPQLEKFEEVRLIKEEKNKNLEPIMTTLKTPHVFNNIHYKNEDRFHTLYNSDNCQEDNRVKELTTEIYTHLVPILDKSEILKQFISNVFEFYVSNAQKKL